MQSENEDYASYLFHQGTSTYAYDYLGCQCEQTDGEYRYTFRTWAPNADAVYLVSDFTDWEHGIPLSRDVSHGVFSLTYTSRLSLAMQKYKYRIVHHGISHYKGDPYARCSEGGSYGATLIIDASLFPFSDDAWMSYRKKTFSRKASEYLSCPLNIYEVHLGSFMRHNDGSFLNYREAADTLIPYAKSMGYTHIELLPIMEFPFDGSWGYQICAFYAPTSRFGTPDDFRYFVNKCHSMGMGLILDWVPAHFPKDEWGLYEFDGQPLYEYQGSDRMESAGWGTRFFDLGREEVQSFLVSNALFWLREYHIDGIRVDAVAAMLYLDFDKSPGDWVPNVYGDNKNLEAIAFLKKLNAAIHGEFPDVMMIAEESTAFGGITKRVEDGGLGFDLKWNMGWANDFYDYLQTNPAFRRYKHKALNFPITYAYSENYILPVSHDEVVHGKLSFLNKMFGSYDEKFASYRAAMLFMMTFPGKKMLFMGTEYGPFREWDYEASLEWFMLDYDRHKELREYTASLNRFYLENAELWEKDFEESGFSWIYPDDADRDTVVYRRTATNGDSLLTVISFSGTENNDYRVYLKDSGEYKIVFATNCTTRDTVKTQSDINGHYLSLDLPPFGGAVLRRTDLQSVLV